MMREKITRDGVVVLKTKINSIGNEKPAIIELKDTYFVMISVIMNTPIHRSVVLGSIARTNPSKVATPLPPLNPT